MLSSGASARRNVRPRFTVPPANNPVKGKSINCEYDVNKLFRCYPHFYKPNLFTSADDFNPFIPSW